MRIQAERIGKPTVSSRRSEGASTAQHSSAGEYLESALRHFDKFVKDATDLGRAVTTRETINQLARESKEYAKEFGIPSAGVEKNQEGGSQADAFRHAYSSGELSRAFGSTIADALGVGHEVHGSFWDGKFSEGRMDLKNNLYGSHELATQARELKLDTKAERARNANKARIEGKLSYLEKQPDGGIRMIPTSDTPKMVPTPLSRMPMKPERERTTRPGRGDWDGSFGPRRDLPADTRFDRFDGGRGGGTRYA